MALPNFHSIVKKKENDILSLVAKYVYTKFVSDSFLIPHLLCCIYKLTVQNGNKELGYIFLPQYYKSSIKCVEVFVSVVAT